MPATVTPGLLAQINVGLQGRFMRGFQKAELFYTKITLATDSNTHSEIYPFLGDITGLEEWIGERQAKDLKAYDFQIKNRHFEATIKINRDLLEDNQVAGFYPLAEILGVRAAEHPDELVASLIINGFTNLCYDGQAFFATTHPVGSTTASNKGTTALAADGVAYAAARAQMMNLTNDAGKKLNIRPNLLVVPPALETVARQLLNNDFISVSGGSTQNNIWKGSADLLVVPQLTDANDWFLFDTKQILPAMIFQTRKAAQLVPRTSLTDDNVFWKNEFVWGVDYRGEAGYAAWQCAFGALVP
jgi:phage major head subunit gpT-like protein